MSRDVKSRMTMTSLSWGSIRKAAKFVYIWLHFRSCDETSHV